MATLLQSAKNNSGSATTIAVALAGTTAGSLMVAYVGSLTSSRTCSASDNVNGAYATDVSANSLAICTFPNNAGGAITVTGAITGAATFIGILFEEWSGVQAVTPLDIHIQGSATATNTISVGPSASLAQANELVLTACHTRAASGAGYVVQSPYTADAQSPVAEGGTQGLAVGWNIVSSTAGVSSTFNWTNSVNSVIALATYKLQAVGAQQPPFYSRRYVLFNT